MRALLGYFDARTLAATAFRSASLALTFL